MLLIRRLFGFFVIFIHFHFASNHSVRNMCRIVCRLLFHIIRMVNGCRSNFFDFYVLRKPKNREREREQQRKLYCISETSKYPNHFDHCCSLFILVFDRFFFFLEFIVRYFWIRHEHLSLNDLISDYNIIVWLPLPCKI